MTTAPTEGQPDEEAAEERAARRLGIRGVLAFAAVFIAAVPFGAILLLLRDKVGWLRTIDLRTANNLHAYDEAHPRFVTAMRVITNSGSPRSWIIVLTIVGAYLLYRRLYRLTAFLALTAIGSSLLNDAIKQVVGRTRPVLDHPIATATGKSFPSGHTQSALVGYGILVIVLVPMADRRWRPALVAVAAIMVALIGFSRVALGVHYVSDVVGALIIGSAWLLAMTAAFTAWRRDRHPSSTGSAGSPPPVAGHDHEVTP